MLSNEVLFYSGIAITVCAIFGIGISMFIFKLKKEHLDIQLKCEYGEE